MTAIQKLTWYCTRIGTIPTKGLQSTSLHSIKSIPLLVEHTFPDDLPLFANGYDITILQISSFYTHSVDGQTKHVWGVFNIHNSHLWTQDNPHAICEHGHQVCFSVSIWTGTVGTLSRAPICFLMSWTLSDIMIFLKWFYLDCSKMCH
jgi:hypothetical protein